ncbi:hypothetical protein KUTG_02381 [Kutzneria sp. 744]|nr:hypothetical protein KUTG_02381 [Kutzneria sp. 744]
MLFSSDEDGTRRALPLATAEAKALAKGQSVTPLDASAINRESLLSTLAEASELHAALHAVSDSDDPSSSRLRAGPTRVTVTEIAALHIEQAWLAYLSACETTLTTAELADEAIHLTAAFQLAGFAHVVGTLWRIPDAVAARAARTFYRYLSDPAQTPASAVHRTVLDLRARYSDSPATWAAHLHMGA